MHISKLVPFLINSVITCTILWGNIKTHLRTFNYQKLKFGITGNSICRSIGIYLSMKKTFLQVFSNSGSEIQAFKYVFGKKHDFVTFDRVQFQRSATHRWKALKEYFLNIYGFISHNLFLFEVNSLIINTILCENIKTHLRILQNQKLKFGIAVKNTYRSIATYQQIN